MLTRFLTTLLPCTALAFGLSAQDQKYTPVPAPLGDVLPALNQQSSWEQNSTYEGEKPDKSKRGVYPVGNGKVFTYMGLGARANTMLAISGPSYAAAGAKRPRGDFGELTLTLNADLKVQRVRRATTGNFVITEDATTDGLSLRTLTFAQPGSTTITRVVVVHNGTGKARPGVVLTATLTGGAAKANGMRLLKSADGNRHASFQLSGATASGTTLTSKLGDLPPNSSNLSVLTITTGTAAPAENAPTVATASDAAAATAAWWKQKVAKCPKLRTDNRRVRDLYNDWKVLMLTLRDAKSGVVTPMVSRRGAWIRESNGPLLAFLRYGMWAEAKALLDYFYNAIRVTGEIREHYPLDLDFASLADKKTDWKKVKFPESDLLSWIVLQHFWYYRTTQDAQTIKSRRPFLVECLSRQKRTNGRLRFSGNENYMRPTLHHLDLASMKSNPNFIAESPENGRRSFSLAASVLFLVAIHGMGDLDNGIDKLDNPAKWARDPSDVENKPSQKWLERSLPVMQELEDNYWQTPARFPVADDIMDDLKVHGTDWQGFFAPAISPVTGQRHGEPVANINLLPLWVGFTFPTGERSQHNLRATLGRLWHKKDANGKRVSALVGTTATVGHFTGDVPGMLLTALIERDGKSRHQVYEDMMRIAEPAGEWGQFYDPDGRPIASDDPDWPHRFSPNECGINIDAAVYALNGIRHVNIPNFDNRAIKVKLRLPKGAKFLEMDNLRKDGREFNVHVDEFYAPLSAEERKQNDAQKDPKYKRDPNKNHRRFRFRMELLSDNPVMGRYQVDADVSGTMFVRYLFKGAVGGEKGIVDEKEFWKEDPNGFYLNPEKAFVAERAPLPIVTGAQILALTNREQCVAALGKDGVTYVDTGLPLGGPELVRAMLQGGKKPTHPKLYLDIGYDASDSRAFKRARFWQHPAWKKALATYEAAGGKILRPRYVTDYAGTAAKDGILTVNSAGKTTVKFTVQADQERDDLVLRIGSSCGYVVRVNGEEIASGNETRRLVRDQDATLVELTKGANAFEIDLLGAGEKQFSAQITDGSGLPVAGVK